MQKLGRYTRYTTIIGHGLSHRYLTLATRLALGGVFLFAGAAKLGGLAEFVNLVEEYRILPQTLTQIYGFLLPGLEIALGLLLVLGIFLRASASVGILVIISFLVAKSFALYQGLEIPCGCFGPVGGIPLQLSSVSLALDVVLLAMGFQILFHRGEFLALGPWLRQKAAEIAEEEQPEQ